MAVKLTSITLLTLIFIGGSVVAYNNISTSSINITILGSSQYVVPGRPFTFTCVFHPSGAQAKQLLQDGEIFEAVQLSNDGSDVCYNTKSAATICDPSQCSCSQQGDIFTAKWTLPSIYTEYIWRCKEFNDLSSPLNLKVAVPVTSVTLDKVTGSQIDVVVGRPVSLTCVTGESLPRSYIQWYIGNDNYTINSTSTVTNGQDELTLVTSILTFTPTKEDANLAVNCKTYNIDPNETVELVTKPKLNVQYGPGNSVILYPPSLNYVVNETYQLGPIECRATCKPSCTYKWIIPGQNDIVENNLTIYNIQRLDAGLYKCIAYNFIANATSKLINITVHYAAKVKSLNISRNNFTISEHSTPTITCHAEGLPLPQITLRHVRNDTIISQATGVDLQYILTSARCEDTGEYKCEAVNKFIPKPPIIKDIFVLCYPRPINLTNNDKQVAYGSGDTLSIAVMYLAYPKPTFRWYFQSSMISNLSKLTNGSYNVRINNIFEYQSEVFRHVSHITRFSLQEEYFGSYTIYAINEVNVTTDIFSVGAQGHPNQPSNVEVKCLDHQSANITWVSEFNNGVQQTFSVRYKMDEKTIVSPEIADPGLKERFTLEITKLKELSTYNFTVVARNKFGETKSLFVNCTTGKQEKTDINAVLGLAIGLGFGSAAVIIIMVIIVIFLIRRIKSSSSKASDTEMNRQSSLTSRQFDKKDEGLSGGAIGENNHSTSAKKSDGLNTDSAKHSAVNVLLLQQKKEEKNKTEDDFVIYSVVNKTKSDKKGGDKGKKSFNKTKATDGKGRKIDTSEDAKAYENVNDLNSASNGDQSDIEKRQKKKSPKTSGKKNQNQLIYLELDLQDQDKDGSRFVIRGIEKKTDYVDVDITKRAEPLAPEIKSVRNMSET